MVIIRSLGEIPKLKRKGTPPNMFSTYFNTTYVKPGSSAQEKCLAGGDPKPTYIWKKDGEELSTDAQYEINANTGDIKIQNVTVESGEGTYQCFAQNSMGTVLSGFWEVKAAYLTGFDKARTTSPTVNEYSYYSLSCVHQPRSVPVSKLDWLVGDGDNTTFPSTTEDKRRIVIDADGTLHFLFVKSSDKENNPYRCQLFNDIVNIKAVSLEKFNLNVLRVNESTSKPILKYSKSVKGTIGSTATLLCIFAGNPIPYVEWFKDGVKLPDESLPVRTSRYQIDPEDSTGRKLIIPMLEIKHEGDYICRATNAYGTNKGTVQVMVTGPPQWNTEPLRSTSIPVGATAIFQCDTVSFHANSSLPMWMKNGEPMIGPPQWNLERLRSTRIPVGITAKFQYDTISYHATSSLPMWMKNGEPMIGYGQEKVIDNKFYFSADFKELKIPNVKENDTMCIQCEVHNYLEDGPNPEPDIVGTTLGNACLTVHTPTTAAFNLWYIALIIGIIILLIIAPIVRYLHRKWGGYCPVDKKEHQAGHDHELELLAL